ncbi:hypothetical protein M728_005607 (plasmid) [Ensifer sp. WSM1721]|uniref:hypothetical protein n=1 Tax=Ensifer sp. WSM1721 TaxID=1041159 RepID=UPI0012EC0DD9|nr:hypothetical protein [Ensifer sp. WSM1721]
MLADLNIRQLLTGTYNAHTAPLLEPFAIFAVQSRRKPRHWSDEEGRPHRADRRQDRKIKRFKRIALRVEKTK